MRIFPVLLFIGLTISAAHAAVDSVAVKDHSIVGMKSSPGLPGPDIIIIKLDIECVLKSKPQALLKFAIDRDSEMNFTTVDEKRVMSGKKRQRVHVVARIEKFPRDMLRGVVLLQVPDGSTGAPPLAMTGISLDVKKFKKG